MSETRVCDVTLINGEVVMLVAVPENFPQHCEGEAAHVFWQPDRCACGRYFDVRPRHHRLPVAYGFSDAEHGR